MASAAIAMMGVVIASNAAAAARRAEEAALRTECGSHYAPDRCDSVCLSEHSTLVEHLTAFTDRNQITYTSECSGPVPGPEYREEFSDFATMLGVFALFGIGGFICWAIFRS